MSEPKLDTVAKPSVTDAYVSEEERVLDPTVLDKSLVERMPNPSGWRLLVLPYKGKGITDGGIHLLDSTVDKENLATSVCYLLKVRQQKPKKNSRNYFLSQLKNLTF